MLIFCIVLQIHKLMPYLGVHQISSNLLVIIMLHLIGVWRLFSTRAFFTHLNKLLEYCSLVLIGFNVLTYILIEKGN